MKFEKVTNTWHKVLLNDGFWAGNLEYINNVWFFHTRDESYGAEKQDLLDIFQKITALEIENAL